MIFPSKGRRVTLDGGNDESFVNVDAAADGIDDLEHEHSLPLDGMVVETSIDCSPATNK